MKSKLDYDPEVFPIIEDHLIFRFRSEKDCSMVMNGGLWFVARQFLAMEAWELDFIPDRKAIQKAIVWLRLPGLLLEYWLSTTILAIAAKAGKLL